VTVLLQTAALAVLAIFSLYTFWRIRYGYPERSIPAVLTYHKVASFELGGTWISPKRFEGHISSLIDSGYRFIDEETFIKTIEGARSAQEKEVLLTFDDGYDCVASEAAPILERMGVPALVFVVSGFAGQQNRWELRLPGRKARHMDWESMKELLGRGFSIGSHCESHRPLTGMPREEALSEMKRSKSLIEGALGSRVSSLSYPFGRANGEIASLAAEAGYRAAFTLYPPGASKGVGRYLLRRDGVWVIDTPVNLRIKLSRSGIFWLEDIKGRMINRIADLTPLLNGDRSG
jgi:peptidoglycan/xylan/chitin deacetylase (PgdA/CDA1 family)